MLKRVGPWKYLYIYFLFSVKITSFFSPFVNCAFVSVRRVSQSILPLPYLFDLEHLLNDICFLFAVAWDLILEFWFVKAGSKLNNITASIKYEFFLCTSSASYILLSFFCFVCKNLLCSSNKKNTCQESLSRQLAIIIFSNNATLADVF